MRTIITTLFVLGLGVHVQAQLYVTNGASVTVGTSSTLYWDGDLVNDGSLNGAGMVQLLANSQTITGTGSINNLRVSSGASVTPANSLTIGNALDVTAGSSLTVPSNMYIVVNGPLTNAGTFNVLNSGSLVQAVGSTLSNSGTFNVQRQGTNSSSVYNYWSSPITSASVPGGNVYQWNPNTSTQDYGDDVFDPGWIAFGGSMVPGMGYASQAGGLATFTGTANNGPISRAMVFHPYSPGNTSPGTPFNLMGNPYPCAISALDLVTTNTDVNGSIYFWDDDLTGGTGYSTSDYAIWNGTGSLGTGAGSAGVPNGFISSGQGFMIRALGGGATLDFDNSMRMTGPNSQFFRLDSEPSRLWLSIEGDDFFNQILIGMIDDATDSEDRLYDAIKVRGNQQIALSALNEESEYSILAFPPPTSEKTIPLNLFVSESGLFNFHSNTIEGFEGYDLYLEDRSDLTYYPLSEGTLVPFQLNSGNHIGRFYLHIGSELVTGVRDISRPDMQAWIFDGQLNVTARNIKDNGYLELLDMAGRQVWASTSGVIAERTTVDVSDLSRGIYVVRLVTPNDVYAQRAVR